MGASSYIFSPSLSAFLSLATARMQSGRGAVLLLEGPPGGGKTEFAKAMAAKLGGQFFRYMGAPDKERNLLYDINVRGVLRREEAWVKGPAWRAFEASAKGGYVVLLIDEVDKTSQGFDAFLLELLEELTFESPEGEQVRGNHSKLAIVLTSNGRRKLRPEVLRRCQRINVPFPEKERLIEIMNQIAGRKLPKNLVDLIIRLGDLVRAKDPDLAPSGKELALCTIDMLELARASEMDLRVWKEVALSYLVKEGGAATLDGVAKYNWAKAIMTETQKGG